MMDRREFFWTALTGTTVLAHSFASHAAQAEYDLIIKGGRVIDPSLRLDAIRDVAIAGGRIAAVEAKHRGRRRRDRSTRAASSSSRA